MNSASSIGWSTASWAEASVKRFWRHWTMSPALAPLALTFLESQSWRWQLAGLAADASLAATRAMPHAKPNDSPSGAYAKYGAIFLAIAASVLLAFGLGTRFPIESSAPQPSALQSSSSQALASQASETSSQQQVVAASPTVVDQADSVSGPQTVTLALGGSEDDSDEIELQVAEADEEDEGWPEELNSSLPSDLLNELRESGLEVVRTQRLFPIDLSDGRRLVIPVEQVDIRQSQTMQGL